MTESDRRTSISSGYFWNHLTNTTRGSINPAANDVSTKMAISMTAIFSWNDYKQSPTLADDSSRMWAYELTNQQSEKLVISNQHARNHYSACWRHNHERVSLLWQHMKHLTSDVTTSRNVTRSQLIYMVIAYPEKLVCLSVCLLFNGLSPLFRPKPFVPRNLWINENR